MHIYLPFYFNGQEHMFFLIVKTILVILFTSASYGWLFRASIWRKMHRRTIQNIYASSSKFEHGRELFVQRPGVEEQFQNMVDNSSIRFNLLWAPSRAGKTYTLSRYLLSRQGLDYYCMLDCSEFDNYNWNQETFQEWVQRKVGGAQGRRFVIVLDNYDALFKLNERIAMSFAEDVCTENAFAGKQVSIIACMNSWKNAALMCLSCSEVGTFRFCEDAAQSLQWLDEASARDWAAAAVACTPDSETLEWGLEDNQDAEKKTDAIVKLILHDRSLHRAIEFLNGDLFYCMRFNTMAPSSKAMEWDDGLRKIREYASRNFY